VRGALGVALLVSRRGFRAWQAYVNSILHTVWLLALFYVLGGAKLLPHVLVGAVLSLALSSGSSSAVYEAYYSLIKLEDAFLASPVGVLEFRFGLALGHLLPSVATILAYSALLALSVSAHPLAVAAALTLVVLVPWAAGVLLGYVVARGDLNAGPKVNLIGNILTLVPPVYYPASILPEAVRPLSYLAPTFNVAELAKILLGVEPVDVHHAALCGFFLGLELAALWVLARRVR